MNPIYEAINHNLWAYDIMSVINDKTIVHDLRNKAYAMSMTSFYDCSNCVKSVDFDT